MFTLLSLQIVERLKYINENENIIVFWRHSINFLLGISFSYK